MIDFNGDPRGWELQALIDRLRYERYVQTETQAIIDRAFNKLVDLVVSGKYRTLTAFEKQRAAELYRSLAKILDDGYTQTADYHIAEMRRYAPVEAQFTRAQIEAIYEASGAAIQLSAGLPATYLASIAKLPIQGLNIGDWFDAQARTMTLEIRRIIQQGLIEGKGPYAIASRIVASDGAQGPVLLRRARNEARTVSRTIVNAVQNNAQITQMARLPKSVSERYVWESVLDSRTSPTCQALSGRVFRYDDPNRRVPPAHPNCRSSIRALLKGIDTTIGDQSTPRTIRNYSSWLTAQPNGVQNDILGPTRAGLFRSGKLSLADAIDQDGRTLNLKQLRERLGLVTAGAA